MTAPIADTRQAGGPSVADYAHEYGGGAGGTPQGWINFAGTMIALAGAMNLMHGIAAVVGSKVLPQHPHLLVANLTAWGWIVLCLGALQIVAAIGIGRGNQLARLFGVVVAFLNAIGQLAFASAYPLWSLTILGIDILVIYALAVHGGRKAPA
jgi:hypothetical protein